MEKQEQRLIAIGELASSAGITVRTLQYYDKTGLLKSTLTESGRRMYTREDVLKLQQILFLKSFGFPLEEIRNNLFKKPTDLEQVFCGQRELLAGEIANLQKVETMLETVIDEIKIGQEISMDKLITMMALMKQGNPHTFMLRYLGDEQIKDIAQRFGNSGEYETYMGTAQEVFAELQNLYHSGADPTGEEGQALAARWWDMVQTFTEDDPSLLKSLMSAGMDMNNWPQEAKEFRDAIQYFLEEALGAYFQNNGIQIPDLEEGKNG